MPVLSVPARLDRENRFSLLDHLLELSAASPLLQVALVILATFVLEDAATVITAIQVRLHIITPMTALLALYVGIILGDIGLYGLGRLAACWPPARRWVTLNEGRAPHDWLSRRLFWVVFVSRFVPGTRLPLYTTCGFLSAGLPVFTLATALATLIWTTALFTLSLPVGDFLLAHLGAWRWVGLGGFVLVVSLMGHVFARIQKHKT